MSPDRGRRSALPEAARQTLDDFCSSLGLQIDLWTVEREQRATHLFSDDEASGVAVAGDAPYVARFQPRHSPLLEVEVRARNAAEAGRVGPLVASTLERIYDQAQEIRFFTFELSERFEEINLLYSISETLGSTLGLDEGARLMLREVCDVMAAGRGSIWIYSPERDRLEIAAWVGEPGLDTPLRVDDPKAVTARVFRESRPLLAGLEPLRDPLAGQRNETETFLSVPIRYTPPEGKTRTIGVLNLLGRRHGGHYTASDQKLLSAIASQVGAAIENNRLIQQSLARERMAREMELAHNLQLKLLPAVDRLQGARVAARVEPAEMVGGDFYQVFQLPGGRFGLMIGDVSSHGFPAALIMALSMSAASIYATEFASPGEVLSHLDEALRDELETTEMYLSLFYGVADPEQGTLTWSNAGHPHAFIVGRDGSARRLEATDPPVGIAGPGEYGELCAPWSPGPDGDLVALFTDGLSDALAEDGTRQGEQRLLDLITEHRAEGPEAIVDALFRRTRASRSTVPSDDRTALILSGE
jgi:sigma-B regulation protein RsbU (phosphoserine phosphatase)